MSEGVADALSPLPGGEREGPAPLLAAWEGEGGIRHRPAAGATGRARRLRGDATDAERRLWAVLRGEQLEGFKFRRQVPIGRYIADFVCARGKLIVEADGGQHNQQADSARTAFLEQQGYRVLRFWNNEVLTNTAGVMLAIVGALRPDHPHPPIASAMGPSLSPPGRGDESDDGTPC